MVRVITPKMPEIEEVTPESEEESTEVFPIKFGCKGEQNNLKSLHLNDIYHLIKNSELNFDLSKYNQIIKKTSMAIPEKGIDPVSWNNRCIVTTNATIDHKLGHMGIMFNPSLYVSALVMVGEPVHKVYTGIEYIKLKLPTTRYFSEEDKNKYCASEKFAKKEGLNCVIGPNRSCSIEGYVDRELYFNFVE